MSLHNSRFFGPATRSRFQNLCEPEAILTYKLHKTMDQALSFTGDLFEQPMVCPDTTNLDEPRMLLVGPSRTCKTRMLSLVGRKGMSEGMLCVSLAHGLRVVQRQDS